jgi:hypothetical protein
MDGLVGPHRVVAGLDIEDSRSSRYFDVAAEGPGAAVKSLTCCLSPHDDNEVLERTESRVPRVEHVITAHARSVAQQHGARNGSVDLPTGLGAQAESQLRHPVWGTSSSWESETGGDQERPLRIRPCCAAPADCVSIAKDHATRLVENLEHRREPGHVARRPDDVPATPPLAHRPIRRVYAERPRTSQTLGSSRSRLNGVSALDTPVSIELCTKLAIGWCGNPHSYSSINSAGQMLASRLLDDRG